MYPILLFALRQRFVGYVSDAESVINLALRILYFLILLVSAAMVGWLIDMFATSNVMPISSHELIGMVSGGFCGLWALLEFFPAYTQRSKLISDVFPISFTGRWGANLIYDTISATTIGTITAFFLIDALSKTYTHMHLVNSLLLFENTVIFVQLVKAFTGNLHRKSFLLFTLWLLLISIIVIAMIYRLPDDSLLTGLLGFCLISQFALLAYVDWLVIETIDAPIFTGNLPLLNQLSPVYVVFMNNPKSRNAFALGLLLKAMFLFFMGKSFMKAFFMNEFLEMVYVAPLVLFSYVANNIWGFFPALWVNSILRKRSDTYRIYFQLIVLPILLDLVITFGVSLYLHKVDAERAAFYVLSTIALSANGLIFSLYKAFYVKSTFNFGKSKNNVNGWSIFTAAILIGLTVVSLKTIWTILLLSVSLIVGTWYLLNKVLSSDTNNTYTLYEKLFVSRD